MTRILGENEPLSKRPTTHGSRAVPLSEHEQRVLQQIEQSLYAEDPKFKAAVSKSARAPRGGKQLHLGIVLVLLGLGVLVLGVWLQSVIVGVLGFLVMFGGGVLGLRAVQGGAKLRGGKKGAAPAAKSAQPSMKDRIEDRMRRRFDE